MSIVGGRAGSQIPEPIPEPILELVPEPILELNLECSEMIFLFVTVGHVPISYLNNIDISDSIKKSHKISFCI